MVRRRGSRVRGLGVWPRRGGSRVSRSSRRAQESRGGQRFGGFRRGASFFSYAGRAFRSRQAFALGRIIRVLLRGAPSPQWRVLERGGRPMGGLATGSRGAVAPFFGSEFGTFGLRPANSRAIRSWSAGALLRGSLGVSRTSQHGHAREPPRHARGAWRRVPGGADRLIHLLPQLPCGGRRRE